MGSEMCIVGREVLKGSDSGLRGGGYSKLSAKGGSASGEGLIAKGGSANGRVLFARAIFSCIEVIMCR